MTSPARMTFMRRSGRIADAGVEECGNCRIWTPSWRRIRPDGESGLRWIVWWLFWALRIFYNQNYRVHLIHQDGKVISRAVLFPGSFRFPFMRKSDVQVGDVWTSPPARGRGHARAAIAHLVRISQADVVWYLTEVTNESSLAAAQGAGFEIVGTGHRRSRLGVAILGYFTMDVGAD